jgi:uncharacterized DUF497 family protein
MYGIAFEWDRKKDSTNWLRHGVGFTEAVTAFGDPLSITIPDPDHASEEERFILVGMSSKRNLLVVVHTVTGERIRLISARSATRHERRKYEETCL